MKQVELAKQVGVSRAYISMVMSGKKKPGKDVVNKLSRLGVNLEMVNFERNKAILSHARLPFRHIPPNLKSLTILTFCPARCLTILHSNPA